MKSYQTKSNRRVDREKQPNISASYWREKTT